MESKSFYADRLDKIQDEISPEDLLWAGGYIICTISKLYAFLDYLNTEFYEPMYDKVLTPDCLTVYTGCIFDGSTLRTYKYDGLRNLFTNRPYKNADMLTRTAISVLPELMYKRYADPSDGYPFSFSSRDGWNEVLDKMIASFKVALYDIRLDISKTYSELMDMQKEGTELYGQYLGNL